MSGDYSVKLCDIVAEYNDLNPVYLSSDYEERLVNTADISRPGLQLMGFYEYYDASRIQIIGKSETTLLRSMDDPKRKACINTFFEHGFPVLIIAHEQYVFPEYIEAAQKFNISIFSTDVDTSEFFAQLIGTLRYFLAPRQTVHGVLIEIYGEGVLITGDSGVGKSETALELIKRGHRLISDDAVEILRTSRLSLEGRAPELIQNMMECRGVGIVDVKNLFGIGAVLPKTRIDLVVVMEFWDESKTYDRLGEDTETCSYLGVTLPKVTIPVRPGRNLAVILELTAMNNRQKKAGYNAAKELSKRIEDNLAKNS